MPAAVQGRHRPWLPAGIFLLVLVAGLAYVWTRPAVYQATADMLLGAPAPSLEAAAFLRQALLDPALLEEARRILMVSGQAPERPVPPVPVFRDWLTVRLEPASSLLALRAEGPDREWLAPLANAWAEAYRQDREQVAARGRHDAATILDAEARQLGLRVEAQREVLDQFRLKHVTLAASADAHDAGVRLDGLNEALDKAVGEALRAESRLTSVKAALARGLPLMQSGGDRTLSQLQGEAAALRAEIADFRRRYQPQMAALHPRMQVLPEQLKRVEAAIRQQLEQGGHDALLAAEQAVAASRGEVQGLREQVTALRREVTEFNARSVQQTAMARDLEDLERLQREFEARQAQASAEPAEYAPEVQLLRAAVQPEWPLWPDYRRDSGTALGASLAAALLAAAFQRRGRARRAWHLRETESPTLSVAEQMLLKRPQPVAESRVGEESSPGETLDIQAEPRELTDRELERLANAAGPDGRQVLGLVLVGCSLPEAVALTSSNVDWVADCLRVGDPPRELPLAPRLRAWLAAVEPCPAWAGELGVEPAELDAILQAAAASAGLDQPETVDSGAIRHTCLLHLMRAGLPPGELESVVGRLPARASARYARFSTRESSLPVKPAAWVHPFLTRSTAP